MIATQISLINLYVVDGLMNLTDVARIVTNQSRFIAGSTVTPGLILWQLVHDFVLKLFLPPKNVFEQLDLIF